jgi:ribonucleotide reductase beta subunit family protein with ferritin-like domain
MTTPGERYTLFPIKNSETKIYQLYKQAVASFWTPEEIDFSKDESDWESLSAHEQGFIKQVLAFFAGADGIVQENLATRFQRDTESPPARLFYAFQNAMEGIHSETYSLLIDKYVKDKNEQLTLFRALDNVPCIKKKGEWAMKWIDSGDSFATRLVGFACVEGIFFSGAFCAIYWLKKRGLLPGLTFSNELISRDEGLHTVFAVEMYHREAAITSAQIHEIIRSAVEIESEFICDSLPCSLIGMNSKLMTQYIQFVADRLAVQLGAPKLYNSQNPFDFMEMISMEGKGNFFERKVSDYSKAGVGARKEDMTIKFDSDDF